MFGLQHDCVMLSLGCRHLQPYIKQTVQDFTWQCFDDGEMHVEVPPLQGASVLYGVSMAGGGRPAHNHMMEVCTTLRAIRKAGAGIITVSLVYGAYTRQDDGGDLMYNLLFAAGADDICIVDPHVLPMPPVQILTHMPVFAKDIKARFKEESFLIVSPDQGGAARASMVADLTQSSLCVLHKQRSEKGVGIMGMEGASPKGRTCILVDDIVQSGRTLMAAADYVKQQGANDVHVYVTHNLIDNSTVKTISTKMASVSISNSVDYGISPNNWVVLPLIF